MLDFVVCKSIYVVVEQSFVVETLIGFLQVLGRLVQCHREFKVFVRQCAVRTRLSQMGVVGIESDCAARIAHGVGVQIGVA